MTRIKILVTLPKTLVQTLDEIAKDWNLNRSETIYELLDFAKDRLKDLEAEGRGGRSLKTDFMIKNDLLTEIMITCKLIESQESKGLNIAFIQHPLVDDVAWGFGLFIDDSVTNESIRNCIKAIAKKHNLNYRPVTYGSQKGLEIYTSRAS